jgi:hypothetical protein
MFRQVCLEVASSSESMRVAAAWRLVMTRFEIFSFRTFEALGWFFSSLGVSRTGPAAVFLILGGAWIGSAQKACADGRLRTVKKRNCKALKGAGSINEVDRNVDGDSESIDAMKRLRSSGKWWLGGTINVIYPFRSLYPRKVIAGACLLNEVFVSSMGCMMGLQAVDSGRLSYLKAPHLSWKENLKTGLQARYDFMISSLGNLK